MPSRRLVRIDAELTGQEMKEAVLCSSGCQALLEHAVVWQKTESIDSLVERMAEYIDTHTRTGTVAVRSWKHDGKMEGVSARELVRKIGGLLSRKGYSIDLDNPNHKIGMVLDAGAGIVACGWMLGTGNDSDGISARRATDRPFFKPVSLDPRLARLAVNLASGPIKKGATVDLMTGTGGFVLEASVSGRIAYGIDLDEEMIAGAQQNLDWAGSEGRGILLHGDATELQDVLPKKAVGAISGFVLDPPYGRNSQGSLAPNELIRAVLNSSYNVSGPDSNFVLIVPIHPFGEHSDEELLGRNTTSSGKWATLQSCFEETDGELLANGSSMSVRAGQTILHAAMFLKIEKDNCIIVARFRKSVAMWTTFIQMALSS